MESASIAAPLAATHAAPHAVSGYIRRHVFGRCGQAVTRLAEAGLVEWPAQAGSEAEVNEWWLVSDPLATRLREAGVPVLRFGELNMWGRSAAGTELREDLQLASAMRP